MVLELTQSKKVVQRNNHHRRLNTKAERGWKFLSAAVMLRVEHTQGMARYGMTIRVGINQGKTIHTGIEVC